MEVRKSIWHDPSELPDEDKMIVCLIEVGGKHNITNTMLGEYYPNIAPTKWAYFKDVESAYTKEMVTEAMISNGSLNMPVGRKQESVKASGWRD